VMCGSLTIALTITTTTMTSNTTPFQNNFILTPIMLR
jgi:hypothetical protein